jgi:plastocyanin
MRRPPRVLRIGLVGRRINFLKPWDKHPASPAQGAIMKRLGTSYALLTLALVACGGDAQQRPRAQGNLAAACQADLALTRAVAAAEEAVGEPPEGGPPPPEFVSRLAQSFEQRVLPVYVRIETNAPSEIRAAVRRRGQALRDFIRAPELEKLDRLFSPEFQAISAFFYRECPGNKVSVEAVDYAFRNLTELNAGVTRIEFVNTGKELHDLIFVTKKPGVREPIEDILKLWSPAGPEAGREYHEKVIETFAGFAMPGEKFYITVNLEPGEYMAVCFIPKGETGQGPPPDLEEEVPHFELGMRQKVTVG